MAVDLDRNFFWHLAYCIFNGTLFKGVYRNRKLQISKAPLGDCTRGISLFTSAKCNNLVRLAFFTLLILFVLFNRLHIFANSYGSIPGA